MRTLSGERRGSLLAAIDRTVTAAGARLLAERLAAPLTDPDAIAQRLDAVALSCRRRRRCGGDLRERAEHSARSAARAGAAGARPRRAARSRARSATASLPRPAIAERLPAHRARLAAELPTGARRRWRGPTPRSPRELARRSPTSCRRLERDGGFVRAGLRRRRSTRPARCATTVRRVDRRAAGALRRGDRHPLAEDPAQQRARLFRRGDRAARREADRARRSTRPSSTARRWPARCASPPPSSPSSRRRSPAPPTARWRIELEIFDALAAAVTAASARRSRRRRRRSPRSTSRRRSPSLRSSATMCGPRSMRSLAFAHRRRAPSGGRAGAAARTAGRSSPTIAICRRSRWRGQGGAHLAA